MHMTIQVEMDMQELSENIRQNLTQDEVIELIKDIDFSESDYNFTKKLEDYFVSEIEKEDGIIKDTKKE